MEHVRKVHSDEFDSKGGENLIIKSTNINMLNLEKVEDLDEKEVEASEELDEEEILDKFNDLAIFDAISLADKKDNFVKVGRHLVKNDLEQEGLAMDWIQSKIAIQRMKRIMRGEFDSRRHNLFLDRYYLGTFRQVLPTGEKDKDKEKDK